MTICDETTIFDPPISKPFPIVPLHNNKHDVFAMLVSSETTLGKMLW